MWDYVTTIRLQLMISALTTSLTNLQIKQPVGLPTKPLDTQTVTSKVRTTWGATDTDKSKQGLYNEQPER